MSSENQPNLKHVEVGGGYYALGREQRRAILRRLLNGMSPNADVRAIVGSRSGPEDSDLNEKESGNESTD